MTPHGMDEHRTRETSAGNHEETGHEPALDDAVTAAMRRVFSRPPAERIAQRHLAAMRTASAEKVAGAARLGGWSGVRERATLRRNPMPALTPRWLATGSALLLAFVMGLAAANALPDSAQNLVAETVSKVGVDLPDPDDDNDKDKDKDKDKDDDAETDAEVGDDADENKTDNHGRTVSSVAHDKSLEGCEHGQAVSAVASSKNNGNDDAPGQSDDDKCDHDADDADDGRGENSGRRSQSRDAHDDEDANDDEDADDDTTSTSTPEDDDDQDDEDEDDDHPGQGNAGQGNSGQGNGNHGPGGGS